MWEQAKALQEGAEIVVCTPVSTMFYCCLTEAETDFEYPW